MAARVEQGRSGELRKGSVLIAPHPPLRTRQRYFVVGVAAVLVITASAYLSVRPLQSGRSEFDQVRAADLARHQVGDLRTTLADWQFFAESYFARVSSAGVKIDPIQFARGSQIAQSAPVQERGVVTALRSIRQAGLARDVETASAEFTKSVTALAPLVAGAPAGVVTAAINTERRAFSRMWSVTAAVTDQLKKDATTDLDEGTDHLEIGRVIVLSVDGVLALSAVVAALALGQRARRRQLADRKSTDRQAFETVLQQALDLCESEADVYDVLGQALPWSAPSLQAEVLIADSSRAHFRRTVSTATDADERSGCGVVSPQACPATSRGHTLVFPSSRALDACRYLKHRPSGECSAVCVPVSIAGKTVGVTHATGSDTVPPTETDIRYLEIASRRASERVAMVRAFEKSETQARSDPLTGLLNRRSLENRVRDLHREGIPYMLAYGDLDNFKILNDTHGHEAGDQALRLFSRVMRDSVRPNDLVSRYGGEEFVIVLPDCSTDDAVAVLERLRERLALALTSGRVPNFTVSFGVSSSMQHDTFDEIVVAADQALLSAKVAGRNRVLVADQPPPTITPHPSDDGRPPV